MIRLIVCDDHEMVRTSLMRVLEIGHHCRIVGDAANILQLHKLLELPGLAFDVLLLDLNLGCASLNAGIDLIKQLLTMDPLMRIVVVSMHDDPDIVTTAIQNGALGYVSKASSIDILQEAIAHAHQGRRFLDPALVAPIVAKRALPSTPIWDAAELTKREREVFVLLCNGQRVSDIAATLCLSIKTISTHKVRLMDKLKVNSNAELIKLGMLYNNTPPKETGAY
jgi:DNA-binding NarL/FixJ family response regulator